MNALDMLATAVLAVVGAVTMAICSLAQPQRIACPDGWTVDGVRLDGTTSCARVSREPETRATNCGRGGACTGDVGDELRVPVRIYCTNGTVPLVVNHRTVGCQRFAGRDLRAERAQ